MIPVYYPDVQVFLHKTIKRETTNGKTAVSQRFSDTVAKQRIDLRPFLVDGGSVQTVKSVREPAGGFQLALVDRPGGDEGSFESMYGLIEPMDMVEIRARHGTPLDPNKPPIIMRGFVTSVTRQESVDGEGRPQRTVLVAGQDFGKIWQIIQISYHAGYLVGQSFISGFGLFEQYGIEPKTTMSSKEFFEGVLTKIINPFLDRMLPANSEMPRAITPDAWVKAGAVSPAIQTQQGTIYELLRYFGDVGPWNEMFVEDREDGVYGVYRPNPYMDATTGELIQADAPTPVYVDVPADDIISMSVSRSDSDVANYYWVGSQRFLLVDQAYMKQEASASGDSTVILKDYPNSSANLYGLRLMTLETQQGALEVESQSSGAKAADGEKRQGLQVAWMADRRRIVSESNKDNVLFERGSMRLRGNENIKAGYYLRLTRGKMQSVYYIVSVSHEYRPFVGFYTNVELERGTGFAERIRRAGSPYLAELDTQ